jgi:hypothetical protein
MRIIKKFNIADLVIILAVAALVFGMYRLSAPREVQARPSDVPVRFTVELGERSYIPEGFHRRIRTGETLFDSQRGFAIGTIVDVYALTYTIEAPDIENNIIRRDEVEGYEHVYIVVEASGHLASYATYIGAFEINVGREVSVRSRDFAGDGFVIRIEYP